MIKISSNNFFFEENLINLIEQKNLQVCKNDSKSYFSHLHLNIEKYLLKIFLDDNKVIEIKLPTDFNFLFNELSKVLNDIVVDNLKFIYFPFKQILIFNDKEVLLRNTHNTILKNLVLAGHKGMSKKDLYLNIWPQDKEMLINKLDTHLTNLKNFLIDNLNLELKIISQKNFVYLNLID